MIFTGSLDRTIRLWKDNKEIVKLEKHSDWIRCLNLSTDNKRLLSGCVSSFVYGWDVETSQVLFQINNKKDQSFLNSINSVSFMNGSNDIFASASRDGYVKIYDTRQSLNPFMNFLAHGTSSKPSKMNSVEFNKNNSVLVSSGRDSTVRLWDMRTLGDCSPSNEEDYLKFKEKSVVVSLNQHQCLNYNLNCSYFNHEKNIITGSEDKKVYIYDSYDGKLLKTLDGHTSVVHLVSVQDESIEPFRVVTSSIDSGLVHFWKPTQVEQKLNLRDEEEDDPLALQSRLFIQKLVEKYGDQMLETFHQNNLTLNSGNMDNFLRTLLQTMAQNGDNPELRSLFQLIQSLNLNHGQEEEDDEEEDDISQ